MGAGLRQRPLNHRPGRSHQRGKIHRCWNHAGRVPFLSWADLWLPLQLDVTAAAPGNDYRVIARLRDAVTLQDAQHELSSSTQYKNTYPLLNQAGEARLVISGLQPFIASGIQRSLTLLFGAVIFVLLITCTSLAVLLTVRASARNQESVSAWRWIKPGPSDPDLSAREPHHCRLGWRSRAGTG